jgi:hypothetical protein
MFEDIITNQARRVAAMENPTHDDMMLITIEDLSDDIGDKTDSKEIEKMEEAAKSVLAPELEIPGEENEKEKGAEPAQDGTGAPAASDEKTEDSIKTSNEQ